MESIHIYHTNDLHSHFEHWPRIHQLLTTRKQMHSQAGDEVLLFDIGDHMDRWHPLSDATRGKGNTDLLNAAGYHAVAIGNNEGITLPYEDLDQMYEKAGFSVLAANLYRENGRRPDWARPSVIYTAKSGVRIGVIGLTVYFSHLYHLLGWKLTDPFEELKNQVNDLKRQADVLILLSHLGIHDDEQIARDFPEIDVILGGHTHHILHEGKMVNGSLLGAAGKYGYYVGHITLDIDPISRKLRDKTAVLYDTNELPPADNEPEMIQTIYDKGKQLLGKEVVTLPEYLGADPFTDSSLPKMLCEGLLEWCEADCAFLNAGLLLDGLAKGKVTRYDLLKICPHPINPCTVELSGAELKEVVMQTLDEKWPHLQILGLGFRGTVMGKFVYEGIEFRKTSQRTEILVRNKEIKANETSNWRYRICSPLENFFRRFSGLIRSPTCYRSLCATCLNGNLKESTAEQKS